MTGALISHEEKINEGLTGGPGGPAGPVSPTGPTAPWEGKRNEEKEKPKSLITTAEHLPNTPLPSGGGLKRIIWRWAAELLSHAKAFAKTIRYKNRAAIKNKKNDLTGTQRPSYNTNTTLMKGKMKRNWEKVTAWQRYSEREVWRSDRRKRMGRAMRWMTYNPIRNYWNCKATSLGYAVH